MKRSVSNLRCGANMTGEGNIVLILSGGGVGDYSWEHVLSAAIDVIEAFGVAVGAATVHRCRQARRGIRREVESRAPYGRQEGYEVQSAIGISGVRCEPATRENPMRGAGRR
jgi:hypothetical protein